MTTFRKITDAELLGFQGCQFDPEGELPDVAERKVGNRDFFCIVDDATCEIHSMSDERHATECQQGWQLRVGDQMTRRARTAIAWAVMHSSLSASELEAFGFERTI